MNIHSDQSTSMINRARRNTLGDLLTRTVARYPEKTALTYNKRSVTYQQLDDLVNQTAHGLMERGVKKENKFVVLSKNCLDFVIVKFALARIGAVFIPINYMLTTSDIAYILNHAEVDGMFAAEEYAPTLDKASQNLSIKHHYLLESDTNLKEWSSLSTLQQNQSTEPVEADIADDDLAQILYTSGTESAPKGVMLSHKSIINEYISCIIDGKMSSEDVLVHALPFYHSAQLHVFLGPSIYLGSSGIILDEANPSKIMETIENHQASQLFAPPTVWIAMLHHPEFDNFQLTSLKKCYYGAAIMPREILRELAKRLPNSRFWNFYGQTEVAPLATALQPEDQLRKLGSAGKPTLHVETKIVDENDIEVPRGEIGEIVHRTPHAMLGYLKEPEKTAEAYQNGWFHSGDLGTMDEDGYITIIDRKKDIINTGGINVSSREVEEVIYQMKEVAEVAVISIPHDYWIEAITAIIVLKDNNSLSEQAVQNYCKQELSAFKSPKFVYFTETLPKNPSGKVLKKDLRTLYEAK
ncbi:fatty acyl-CoA synthetase [Pseudogracilibacillus sp. SE30717A]|uniref:fatty acyl-CoA synthetase n=1 Tax=Pseudogracilibacillus sp. SE30717A TaxID=3098293 RepID=UPI00300E0DFD